ncbi:MAG: cell division protein FtsB [gamma proteobacterium symbiont of Bathyaustriella thionipta]|nr:cell division protein FtsB [gamma proteobacterium symbiont of Bathyaustriella thionipta]MCU7949606.1 cell division protein FtsB [gamma proteobacterium symbiont of Bathyaustriella thionipta]MCU7953316.1 cell division protein FtsB [gamma proteobacterium symbiont of Bathyaustriella thionipta]MCU7956198.1 cell division protein FtsB [gamma proteobacterium symbiont of Bathyaustriella thionipta]MCU7968498.1 cell division protein FtsB [gamma proteobacterium symbiont of Bathyaustriella thionipta]
MNYIIGILLILLVTLQYDLWVGEGSIVEVRKLEAAIELQTKENKIFRERNDALQAEVLDLKNGFSAIEERVRTELGMIKNDETFFHVIENKHIKTKK